MGEYVETHRTAAYEVGIKDDLIVAACCCGQGLSVLNKGFGRAVAATWRTRHQHPELAGNGTAERDA